MRLNADDALYEGVGLCVTVGAGAGPERSKRLFMVDVAGGGAGLAWAFGGDGSRGADVKSAKSPKLLERAAGAGAGFVAAGMAAEAGLVSKKLPPVLPVFGIVFGMLVVAGCAGEEKSRPPNVSTSPPMLVFFAGALVVDEKEKRSCDEVVWAGEGAAAGAGAGAGFGVAAYSDRIDCLRSVRLLAAPDSEAAALVERAGAAPGASPKKSRPSSDSPGLVAFGGTAGALTGGGRDDTVGSTVLGRGGAIGSSSKRF